MEEMEFSVFIYNLWFQMTIHFLGQELIYLFLTEVPVSWCASKNDNRISFKPDEELTLAFISSLNIEPYLVWVS